MRQKVIATLAALLFFIWILPLGVFIDVSDEKLACNGQRAICLCKHLMEKSGADQIASVDYGDHVFAPFSSAPIFEIQANAVNAFLNAVSVAGIIPDRDFVFGSFEYSYQFLFVSPVDHVPKV